jgi:IS605 OrfB family transposase
MLCERAAGDRRAVRGRAAGGHASADPAAGVRYRRCGAARGGRVPGFAGVGRPGRPVRGRQARRGAAGTVAAGTQAGADREVGTARQHGAGAVVIEDLDFADARRQGRERAGHRPSQGRRGRAFRRQVAGIPTARFRDRLTQMAGNAGIAVIAVDPACTSRWGAQHWLAPMRQHHPELTGHHAAAIVIGRRGLGLRARRRATGNLPAPEDAAAPDRARSTQARPGTHPKTGTETRRPAARRDPRQPPGTKTGRPRRTTAGDPGPFGAAHQAGLAPAK